MSQKHSLTEGDEVVVVQVGYEVNAYCSKVVEPLFQKDEDLFVITREPDGTEHCHLARNPHVIQKSQAAEIQSVEDADRLFGGIYPKARLATILENLAKVVRPQMAAVMAFAI